MYIYINIGSNKGNCRLNLAKAIRLVSEKFGPYFISRVVESEPWGFDSDNIFLNVGMAFQSDMAPLDILYYLQDIERQISPASHRNPDGTYADRIIDIDIMGIEGITMDTPELTLPHPHLAERDFFMQPLRELQQEIAESCNDSTTSTHSGH